ncbi:MAG: PEP-CTERM sorting domain-containing protein [Methylophilaceae bacterium]
MIDSNNIFNAKTIRNMFTAGILACAAMVNSAYASTIISWPSASDRTAYSSYTTINEGGADTYHNWGVLSIWDISAMGGQTISLCVERHIGGGWASSFDVTTGLSPFFSSTQQSALDRLITNTLPTFFGLRDTYISTSSSSDLAAANNYALAMQLAVWEIVEETGSYDLASGSIYLSGTGPANTAADALAIGFINNITSGPWTTTGGYTLSYAFSDTKQDQLLITAVPEPSSWAMLLAGLSTVILIARRRSKARKAAI